MKTEYLTGNFVDFEGRERQFVLAAVSVSTVENDTVVVWERPESEGDIEWAVYDSVEIPKAVYVGVSICHPSDVFDEEKGMKIARGKALSEKTRIFSLYTTEAGAISTPVVKALLEQEAKHLSVNPGKYIAGYDNAKAKFVEKMYYKTVVDELTDEQVKIVEHLASIDESKLDEILYVVSKVNEK